MNTWQITRKDLRLLLRDRRSLFVLIALPMLFITILGFSAGQLFSAKVKTKKVRLGLVNQDTSPLAIKLLDEVRKLDALEISELSDSQEAKELLADGKFEVLVIVGSQYHVRVEELDFSDIMYVEQGKLANRVRSLDIEVHAGAFLASAAEIVEALVFAFSVKTIAPDVLEKTDPQLAHQLYAKIRKLRVQHLGEEVPAAPREAFPTKTRAEVIYQFLVPSYTVMFVFFIVNFMASSMIGERDLGTLHRLLIAPLNRTELMLGKTIPFLVISLGQSFLLFLAGKLLFQMSWGQYPWMLLPVMICTSLAATSLGLMVATIVKTDSQVSAYASFLVLTLAALSGCLMPRNWQPELMQQIGLATPHAWALIAYDQLLNRDFTSLRAVWRCCSVLLMFTAGFFTIGWLRFRTLE